MCLSEEIIYLEKNRKYATELNGNKGRGKLMFFLTVRHELTIY